MAIIKFKSRSLIRRFGTKPVRLNDSLAKQYVDRGQASTVRKEIVVEEEVLDIEDIIPDEIPPEEKEEVPDEETETEDQDSEEEQIELKIKKPKK